MAEEDVEHIYCSRSCPDRTKRTKKGIRHIIYNPTLKKYNCEKDPYCDHIHELNLMTQMIDLMNVLVERLDPEKLLHEIEVSLSLPDHLRKTRYVIKNAGVSIHPEEIIKKTKRARAVESGYANLLVTMTELDERIGIHKERRGRKTYFYYEKP